MHTDYSSGIFQIKMHKDYYITCKIMKWAFETCPGRRCKDWCYPIFCDLPWHWHCSTNQNLVKKQPLRCSTYWRNLTPKYNFNYKPCGNRKGGGVGILTRKPIKIKLLIAPTFSSFEYIDCDINLGKSQFHFVIIHHPPPSKVNKLTTSSFLEEFTTLLECLLAHPGNLIIAWDFKLHIDVPADPSTIKFNDIINSLGLTQHMISGSPTATQPLLIILIDPKISDHSAIVSSLNIPKPPLFQKSITYRKIKAIDKNKFILDLK